MHIFPVVPANAINAPAAVPSLPIIGMDHSSNGTERDRKRSVRMNNGENMQKGFLLFESYYLTIQPNGSVMAVRPANPIYGKS